MENNENGPKTISAEEIGEALGGKVSQAPEQPAQAPAEQPAVEQPQVPVQHIELPPLPTAEPVKEEKKKSIDKKTIIILIIVLIIALIVIGVFLALSSNKEKTKTDVKPKPVYSKYRMTGNDLQTFDLAFLQLENEKENKVYSPLSIKYALEMLAEGADGETKKQINDVIGKYEAKSYTDNEHMSFANAMFIKDTFKNQISSKYTDSLKEKYNAEVIVDPFTSPDNMNNWISKKTFNLINNFLDDSVKEEKFELINALAIDMNWQNRIQSATGTLPAGMGQIYYYVNYAHENYQDSIDSIEDDSLYPAMKFNGVDNTKSVIVGASFNHYDIIKDKGEDNIRKNIKTHYEKYLNEHPDQREVCPQVDEYVNKYIEEISENYKQSAVSTDYYINDTDNEKVFAKDLQTYDGITLQYIGIMPKKEDLVTYIKNAKAKDLTQLMVDMKKVEYDSFEDGVITQIKGNIPLFKYDYTFDLKADLQKLGIKNVFDSEEADLSNMLTGDRQYIDSANHKAVIEFSNDGIKAAAVTSMGGRGSAKGPCAYEEYVYDVPVKKIDITFDKPYLYIICDKDTGEVWFMGTVYEPLKK